ncbi:MAG: tetratricopeptide repeat protein [Planctomycetes bacterium]|nr:tetratricopeptide repeat protein [Planctomycetota bacterium]
MQEFKPNDAINNRYRVLRKLGAGAMGSVYLCQDGVENNIKVALKVLISDNLEDQDVWAKGEYEALTRLRHPNLAKVYNFGRIEDTKDYFIVSEFIKGIDLFSATEYLKYDEIVDIVVQVCRALEYIHSQGYVHFDVKPDNILVSRQKTIGIQDGSKVQYDEVDFQKSTRGLDKPTVKLIDFGLAEKITGSFSFAIKGTLNYLAPEILNGTTPDKRADLYSLGVTIYQVVNRDLPFYHEPQAPQGRTRFDSRSELFEANMKKHPEYLRELIMKLIEENPENRFQSAKEVIQFINKHSGFEFEVETEETRASYFHSPRLVGRKKEMNLLKHHHELIFFPHRARARSEGRDSGPDSSEVIRLDEDDEGVEAGAHMILVSGEMGSGKSRLIEEFQHILKLNDTNVFKGNCYEGNQKAYQPVIELLRQLVYAVGPQSDVVRRYQEFVTMLLPELRAAQEGAEKDPPFDSSRPEKNKQYFIDRISQLMIDISREIPYTLMINNLHWIDEASVDLLEKLAERMVETVDKEQYLKMMVVMTQRSEEQASQRLKSLIFRWKEIGFCIEVPVRRLKRRQISELLQSMLRIADIPDDFSEKLEEQTGGNPLFLVETLKALEDEGIIKQQVDGWVIKTTKYSRVEIPHSMEDLLLKRLDRLDSLKRVILQTMAVLDKPVSPKFLQQFERFSQTPILVELRDLEAAGIVQKTFENGKLNFTIQQPKVREILYAHTEEDLRRRLHGEVGAAFEELYRHREEEILEELAYHYQRSDRADRAMKLALRAGDRLKAIYANDRAYEYYSYVLGEVEDRPEYIDIYFDTREKLGGICTTMGSYDEAVEHYTALLEEECQEMLPPERVTDIFLRRGKVCEIQGDYDMALHCYKDARNYLSRRGRDDQVVERSRVYNSIGWVYVCMGKYEKAMTISLEGLRVIHGVPEGIEHAMIYGTIGSANFYKGNIEEAVEYHRKSLLIKEHLEDMPAIVISLNNLGEAYLAGAEYGEALETLRRALATSEEIGDPYGQAMTMHNLAYLYCATGDLEKANEYLEQSIAQSRAYNMRYLSLQNYIVRGMVLAEQGDYAKAECNLFRVLTAYSKQGNRAGLCSILLRISAVHRRNMNLEDARTAMGEARRYAADLGIPTLRARVCMEEARICRSSPERDCEGAAAHLSEALGLSAGIENPELLGELNYEMAEALVSMREVTKASQFYKTAEERFREVIENLPQELRATYEIWQKTRFPNWSTGSQSIELPRQESGGDHRVAASEIEVELVGTEPEDCEPVSAEASLRMVSELMEALPASGSLEEFLDALLDRILVATGSSVAYVLSLSGRDVSIEASCHQLEEELAVEPGDLICLQLIDSVLRGQQPLFLPRSSMAPEVVEQLDSSGVSCSSLAIFPFPEPGGKRGALYLVDPRLADDGTGDHLLLIQPFLNLIPVACMHFASAAPSGERSVSVHQAFPARRG